jgi:hypothetical protein
MELSWELYKDWLWNREPSETDRRRARPRNYLEAREHTSAVAFVKGIRRFAREELEAALPANRHQASQELIESSHQLIEEKRRLTAKTKNTLAFLAAPES